MAFTSEVEAVLDRLANYYNGGGYDPQNNPGGWLTEGIAFDLRQVSLMLLWP